MCLVSHLTSPIRPSALAQWHTVTVGLFSSHISLLSSPQTSPLIISGHCSWQSNKDTDKDGVLWMALSQKGVPDSMTESRCDSEERRLREMPKRCLNSAKCWFLVQDLDRDSCGLNFIGVQHGMMHRHMHSISHMCFLHGNMKSQHWKQTSISS